MGWWNMSKEGYSLQAEATGMLWGDDPADVLDRAAEDVIKGFEDAWGRPPSYDEIQAGLRFSALGERPSYERYLDSRKDQQG